MGRILLVRHGQATTQGDDYDLLTPLGERQSRLLGAWFARVGRGAGRSVTGSLLRHRQTHLGFLDGLDAAAAAPIVDAGFDEFDFVDVLSRFDGRLTDFSTIVAFMTAAEDPARTFREVFGAAVGAWVASGETGGHRESWPAFRARVVAALDSLAADLGADEEAMVFTSGGVIAAICTHVLGVDGSRFFDLNAATINTGVTRLTVDDGRLALAGFNAAAHLEWPGEPGLVTRR